MYYLTPHRSLRGTPSNQTHDYFCSRSISVHTEWDEDACCFKLTFTTKYATKVFLFGGEGSMAFGLDYRFVPAPGAYREDNTPQKYPQMLLSVGLGTGGTGVHSMRQAPRPDPPLTQAPSKLPSLTPFVKESQPQTGFFIFRTGIPPDT